MKKQKIVPVLTCFAAAGIISCTSVNAATEQSGSNQNGITNTLVNSEENVLETTESVQNGWIQDGEDYYWYENGEKVLNEFRTIEGSTYFFDWDGKMLKNIHNKEIYDSESGTFYYYAFDESGAMRTSEWVQDNELWTYYNEYGHKAVEEFYTIDGYTYYFNYLGYMVTDEYGYTIYNEEDQINYIYGFDSEGHMKKNEWYNLGGEDYEDWCYFGEKGYRLTGKSNIGGTEYLFNYTGNLLCNYEGIIYDTFYVTDNNGVVISEKVASDGWLQNGEDWFYVEDGAFVTNEFRTIDGNTYYFNYDGRMIANNYEFYIWNDDAGESLPYGFDENGHLLRNEWVYIADYDNAWCYFGEQGYRATGKYKILDKNYLFDYRGLLLSDFIGVENNVLFATDSEGVILFEKEASNGWAQYEDDWFYSENGQFIMNEFKTVDGYTYYFNYAGFMSKNSIEWIYNSEEDIQYLYGFDASGHMITNDWFSLDYDSWHYFDGQGHAVKGEYTIEGVDYLFDEDSYLLNDYSGVIDNCYYETNTNGEITFRHELVGGWNFFNGSWYYVENGELVTGTFKNINGNTYYFGWDGIMVADSTMTDYESGYVYGFNESGHMIKNNWYNFSFEGWYYFDEQGHALTGVNKINDINYLFNVEGQLQINFTGIIGNTLYFTDENGVITYSEEATNGWVNYDGLWFYGENGSFVVDEFRTIDGYRYYFNYNGQMLADCVEYVFDEESGIDSYFGFDASGHMLTNTWYDFGDYIHEWYYFDEYGHAATDEYTINGSRYLFNYTGELLIDFLGIHDNKLYEVNSQGVIIQDYEPTTTGWYYAGGKWFYAINEMFVRNRVMPIDGSTYYLNYEGQMVTDYFYYTADSGILYFDASGKMVTNTWVRESDLGANWYYFGNDGLAVNGWQYIDNAWYYFEDGIMFADTVVEENGTYYLIDDHGVYLGVVNTTDGWNLNAGNYYYVENGQVCHGWKYIDNNWYYFDELGIMVKNNFYYIDGEGYYSFDSSGAMLRNQWIERYGYWSYVKADGTLAKDWLQIGNAWYYFDFYFRMADNNIIIDNTLYTMNSNGIWTGESYSTSSLNGWVKTDFWEYYIDGEAVTGWQYLDGNWYYFNSLAEMQTGVVYVEEDKKYYLLSSSGNLLTNGWHFVEGSWFYVDASGAPLTGWQYIDNTWYYLNMEMETNSLIEIDGIYYLFDANGHYTTVNIIDGWNYINNNWYYFKNGEAVTGKQMVDGVFYYFDQYGTMLTDHNPGDCIFGSNGVMITSAWYYHEGYWYYANAQGDLYRNQVRVIDGVTYIFDEMGRMM